MKFSSNDFNGIYADMYEQLGEEKVFAMCMNEVNKEFSEDMKVVCEEFKVVFKI